MSKSDTSRVSRDSLRISSHDTAGWQPLESGQVPEVGELVHCTEGIARVVRVLGRTSDGSRLLELRCTDRAQPFFAASSNVLVRDDSAPPSPFLDPSSSVGGI
jgi:hypothetical protein